MDPLGASNALGDNIILRRVAFSSREQQATYKFAFNSASSTTLTFNTGGTILTHLLKSDNPALKNAIITCLVRGEQRISQLEKAYGSRVKAELYQDLDDVERTIEVTSQHDYVINTTLGFHPESAAALVKGLAKRKQSTGKDTFMIHTSGTSNLADQPITGKLLEDRVFDDAKDDIYGYEKEREKGQLYLQRNSELGVVDAGIETGVKVLVIMSPTIYGRGSGIGNTSSIQVPAYVKTTLASGQGVVVGEGKGIWDNVHVEDLAGLYELVLLNQIQANGSDLPTGKKAIIFSGNGRHTWGELAAGVAQAAYQAGQIKTAEVKSVTIEEAANLWPAPWNEPLRVELGLSSNSRTESTVGRQLGWKPSRSAEAWKDGFTEEVKAALEQK
ncbi:uncharacterized protein LTR77_007643 [Saxophila tyrrhenica]|uniref:NAD-dependent epimerase/dehydratase domain-containing protein n=1 Tax=Saxophila tyrrhenica TaxID=1690608 RepID=A0AAV9P4M6_9PEZI|nr:hypothetical protein LTR77_007643 [Saxophila tyrrhenica]